MPDIKILARGAVRVCLKTELAQVHCQFLVLNQLHAGLRQIALTNTAYRWSIEESNALIGALFLCLYFYASAADVLCSFHFSVSKEVSPS